MRLAVVRTCASSLLAFSFLLPLALHPATHQPYARAAATIENIAATARISILQKTRSINWLERNCTTATAGAMASNFWFSTGDDSRSLMLLAKAVSRSAACPVRSVKSPNFLRPLRSGSLDDSVAAGSTVRRAMRVSAALATVVNRAASLIRYQDQVTRCRDWWVIGQDHCKIQLLLIGVTIPVAT